jgi:hypothetical protein
VAGNPPTVVAHSDITPYFDDWWASNPHCLPHETVRPQVSGSPAVGEQLSASPGSWLNRLATGFAYQWRRCDLSGAACTDIPGAAGPTYVPTADDLGHTLRARVAATQGLDIEQLTPQDSDATAAVAPGASPPATGTAQTTGTVKTRSLAAAARSRSTITLNTVLRHGLRFKVRCSAACRVGARLLASLKGKHGHRAMMVLAVTHLHITTAGMATGHLRVNRKLRSRLRSGKPHELMLRVDVSGGHGRRQGIVKRIRVIG